MLPMGIPMAGFEEWAVLQRLHDGTGKSKLVKNLYYHSEEGTIYTVPRGFITDLASVPRILWPMFPPYDNYASAAVLHDHLYTIKTLKRKECDLLLLEAMSHSNVPKWKCRAVYLAVRLFGGRHY